MAACCTECRGKGYTVEPTERGTTLTSRCYRCQGTGGWDEIDTEHGSPLAKALTEAASRRREGLF